MTFVEDSVDLSPPASTVLSEDECSPFETAFDYDSDSSSDFIDLVEFIEDGAVCPYSMHGQYRPLSSGAPVSISMECAVDEFDIQNAGDGTYQLECVQDDGPMTHTMRAIIADSDIANLGFYYEQETEHTSVSYILEDDSLSITKMDIAHY